MAAAAQLQQSPEPAKAPPQRARSKRGAESMLDDNGALADSNKRSRVSLLLQQLHFWLFVPSQVLHDGRSLETARSMAAFAEPLPATEAFEWL